MFTELHWGQERFDVARSATAPALQRVDGWLGVSLATDVRQRSHVSWSQAAYFVAHRLHILGDAMSRYHALPQKSTSSCAERGRRARLKPRYVLPTGSRERRPRVAQQAAVSDRDSRSDDVTRSRRARNSAALRVQRSAKRLRYATSGGSCVGFAKSSSPTAVPNQARRSPTRGADMRSWNARGLLLFRWENGDWALTLFAIVIAAAGPLGIRSGSTPPRSYGSPARRCDRAHGWGGSGASSAMWLHADGTVMKRRLV